MILGKKRTQKVRDLLQRQLSESLKIDTPMYSKIECGEQIS